MRVVPMSIPRRRWAFSWGVLALASVASAAGCEPASDPAVWSNGPPFLIVGKAAAASSPEAAPGTEVYVQGRGGNYVGILTRAGKHQYPMQESSEIASCVPLPAAGEPLYLYVEPTDDVSTLEARLYYFCGSADGGRAAVTLDDCSAGGTLVAGAAVSVTSPRLGATVAPIEVGDE